MNVIDQLKGILASTFSLGTQAQLAHWNVVGPRFVSLHKLFGNQYDELYGAADAIAEYIRSKDTKVFAPGGLTTLARLSSIKEMMPTGLSEEKFIDGVIAGHDVLINLTKECGDQAGEEGDTDTQNFMNERSTSHKKMRWMLVSSR